MNKTEISKLICGHPCCPEQWASLSVRVLGYQAKVHLWAELHLILCSFQALRTSTSYTKGTSICKPGTFSMNWEHIFRSHYKPQEGRPQANKSQLPRDLGWFLARQSQTETMSSETSAQTPVSGLCCWKLRVLRAACSFPPPLPWQPSQGKDFSTDLWAKLRNSELLSEELDTTLSSLEHQDLWFNLLTCSRQGQFLILRTRHHTTDWKNLSRTASIEKEFSNT